MRYNVAQLLKGPTGEQRRYDFDEDIRHLDPGIEILSRLQGSVVMMRTSQGILVTGTLRTKQQALCRRCLEPSVVDVELDLEEEFYPTAPIAGATLDDVPEADLDGALLIDEHHTLDLSEVIRQGLWLAAPMQALCRPDCAGLCPDCGGNRNLGECKCDQVSIDPRWAALQALLTNEIDSDERSD